MKRPLAPRTKTGGLMPDETLAVYDFNLIDTKICYILQFPKGTYLTLTFNIYIISISTGIQPNKLVHSFLGIFLQKVALIQTVDSEVCELFRITGTLNFLCYCQQS